MDHGRVADLAKDIVGHYEAIKAESIRLFLDRDDLHWGDEWRDEIDDALANVAFFIPVITPRYFKSVECRRELQFFAIKAEQLGITELIMPILYIEVPELREEKHADPLMQLVKRIQWEDWTQLRWADRTSAEYRKAVNGLAQELVRRVGAVEETDVVAAAARAEDTAPEGATDPGVLERLAALEEAIPRWSETMEALTVQIARIGELMHAGQADVERGGQSGKGLAARRLSVARRIASELAEPVNEIEALGQAFAADLAHIDAGLRLMLVQAPEQIRSNPESLDEVCGFLQSIRDLSEAAREGLGAAALMLEASEGLERMSKDMRAPIRKLRTSLRAMSEAQQITNSWRVLVDETGIDCSGATGAAGARS